MQTNTRDDRLRKDFFFIIESISVDLTQQKPSQSPGCKEEES